MSYVNILLNTFLELFTPAKIFMVSNMHKLKIMVFSFSSIMILSLSIDVNACTSLLISPEALCEQNDPIYTKGFKKCYFELLDLSEEEFKNTYDPCLNPTMKIPYIPTINKDTSEYIYLDLLRQEFSIEKRTQPVMLRNSY